MSEEPVQSNEAKKETSTTMTETQKKIAPPKWSGCGHESPDDEARFLEFAFFDS